MKQAVKESARSAEVRAELREQGYKIMWDACSAWYGSGSRIALPALVNERG